MHARQALCMRRPLPTGVTIRDLPAASCVGAAPADDRGCASCWPGVTPGILWRGPRSCTRGPSASRTGVVSLAGGGSDRPGPERSCDGSPTLRGGSSPPPTTRPHVTRMPCTTWPVHARHVMHVGRGAPAIATPPLHTRGAAADTHHRAPTAASGTPLARHSGPGTGGRDPHTKLPFLEVW